MRRVALLLAVALLLGVQSSEAAVSHPKRTVLARGIIGATAADGDHLVGWGGGGGRLALCADRTRTKSLVELGRACSRVLPIDASAGSFLINCGVNGPQGP